MQMANVASNQGEFTMWINYGSLVVALFAGLGIAVVYITHEWYA